MVVDSWCGDVDTACEANPQKTFRLEHVVGARIQMAIVLCNKQQADFDLRRE